jgi:hypothetical protein
MFGLMLPVLMLQAIPIAIPLGLGREGLPIGMRVVVGNIGVNRNSPIPALKGSLNI